MRAAEQALIDGGTTVEALMQVAGRGAADWVWRVAGRHAVTVLCGPGNNGGDGYVIAQALHERGGSVAVIAATEPKTVAAQEARKLYRGEVLGPDAARLGEVLVDCLFGSGLTRPLEQAHAELLGRLAASHRHCIAVDLPSGVQSDTGALLNDGLPHFDLTIALGAWKFAHVLMPASATLGALKLVQIGVGVVDGAAGMLGKPKLAAPAADAHKYRRGLLAVVGGAMPGAAVLACRAAMGAGAGYVKLLGEGSPGPSTGSGRADSTHSPNPAQAEPVEANALPPDLVADTKPLGEALADARIDAILIGPGLGRDGSARVKLAGALGCPVPLVLDADALMLLTSVMLDARRTGTQAPLIATPHEGELAKLETAFGATGLGAKPDRALALARATGMIIVAKGPDTVIAAPDGRLTCAPRASSWLSTAGTGDVLAGTIASRLATGIDPFAAACEGVWIHAEAARLCPPAFTAAGLAAAIPLALGACL